MDASERPSDWRRLDPLWDAVLLEAAIAGGGAAKEEHLALALLTDVELAPLLSDLCPAPRVLRQTLIGKDVITPSPDARGMTSAASVLDDDLLRFVDFALTNEQSVMDAKVAILQKCLLLPEIRAWLIAAGLDINTLATRLDSYGD